MPSTVASQKKKTSIKVPVTAGNLRNGHVYIRDHLWFFPKSAIRGEKHSENVSPCILELKDIAPIETDIDPSKGIFRWRGWKKFFQHHRVREGDLIVFDRQNRSHFSVSVEHRDLEGFEAMEPSEVSESSSKSTRAKRPRRCNDLSGDEWVRYSISVWSDIRKTAEELALNHPAMFPTMLCERLITMFLRRRGSHRVLDPFMGSGSTLLAARNLGKIGIGFEISEEYVSLAQKRLDEPNLFGKGAPDYEIIEEDARKLSEHARPKSIDLCITSPPYWDILNQKRSADYKKIRHYGNLESDLGIIDDYQAFLSELQSVFRQVYEALRPGAYCAVVVMDIRKKNQFFAFHSDLASRLSDIGFLFDDLIIWNRGHEYNNLRPLGYPSVFRINKTHEFILLFQKPGSK